MVLIADGEGEEGGSLILSHLAARVPFWSFEKHSTQIAPWADRQPVGEARVGQNRRCCE
jgi:hypothetical protein